jgi:hypothetical protein
MLVLAVCACKREPAISIEIVDEASARKTYGYLTDIEKDSVFVANPEMRDSGLEKAGFIKEGRLLVEKINGYDSIIRNTDGRIIKLKWHKQDYPIKVTLETANSDSLQFEFEGHFTDYCIADVVPGGYQEIITLNQYYIVNGDNFEVTVYEVKTKD